MKNIKKTLLATLLFTLPIFLYANEWEDVAGLQILRNQGLTLTLTNRVWHALKDEKGAYTIFSQDGELLQDIDIRRVPLYQISAPDSNISLKELKKLLISYLKSQYSLKSFKLIKTKVEKIANKKGIQIFYEIKDEYQNTIEANATYFVSNGQLYSISYIAPKQYYYNKNLEEYKKIKKSVSIKNI